MREEYREEPLRRRALKACPVEQFELWMAKADKLSHPNACTLATADAGGKPTARAVLLKGVENGEFLFYTNFGSRKAKHLESNPWAALHFPWWELQRQVSVEGSVSRMSDEDAEAYYRSRPLDSRLGAWASRQSEVIDSRDVLEQAFDAAVERFGEEPPKPPFWGGYKLRPEVVEFWHGGPGRLHDRFRYRRADDEDAWTLERLSP